MTANAINRKTIRQRIVSHFDTDLTGTGNPVEAVYSYDRRDFDGESPVVVVLSTGVGRIPFGLGTEKFGSAMQFAVLLFVREADEDAGWSAQNVIDALDDTEKAISDCVMNHRKDPGYWTELMFEPDSISEVAPAVVGGVAYRLEIMSLVAEVYDA